MKLLAIDTVTEACSVALWLDGEILAQEEVVFQQHTERVLPMLQALLAQSETSLSQFDAIVFDRGPGSFTGLRIGAGVTQGLALGLGLPVLAISSLQTLAQGAWRTQAQERVFSAIDARQAEVYGAAYQLEGEIMMAQTQEQIGKVSEIQVPNGSWFGVGTGFDRYATEFDVVSGVNWIASQGKRYPLAQDMFVPAQAAWSRQEWVQAADAIPIYLRDNVATPPSK